MQWTSGESVGSVDHTAQQALEAHHKQVEAALRAECSACIEDIKAQHAEELQRLEHKHTEALAAAHAEAEEISRSKRRGDRDHLSQLQQELQEGDPSLQALKSGQKDEKGGHKTHEAADAAAAPAHARLDPTSVSDSGINVAAVSQLQEEQAQQAQQDLVQQHAEQLQRLTLDHHERLAAVHLEAEEQRRLEHAGNDDLIVALQQDLEGASKQQRDLHAQHELECKRMQDLHEHAIAAAHAEASNVEAARREQEDLRISRLQEDLQATQQALAETKRQLADAKADAGASAAACDSAQAQLRSMQDDVVKLQQQRTAEPGNVTLAHSEQLQAAPRTQQKVHARAEDMAGRHGSGRDAGGAVALSDQHKVCGFGIQGCTCMCPCRRCGTVW